MEVEKGLQKKEVGKNTSIKGLGSCDRVERKVCAKKGESIFIVKRKKEKGTDICKGLAKERVYLTL